MLPHTLPDSHPCLPASESQHRAGPTLPTAGCGHPNTPVRGVRTGPQEGLRQRTPSLRSARPFELNSALGWQGWPGSGPLPTSPLSSVPAKDGSPQSGSCLACYYWAPAPAHTPDCQVETVDVDQHERDPRLSCAGDPLGRASSVSCQETHPHTPPPTWGPGARPGGSALNPGTIQWRLCLTSGTGTKVGGAADLLFTHHQGLILHFGGGYRGGGT